jgi:hypothetical protein
VEVLYRQSAWSEPSSILAALDAADAAAGIVRVDTRDEALILRVAQTIFADEQCDRTQMADIPGNWWERLDDVDRLSYRSAAMAVLAVLAGDPQ